MQAAGVLHWKSLRRQVRFRGPVELVADPERMRISPPGRARAVLAHGQASSPALLKAHSRWKKPSPGKLSVSTSEQCPGLHIGQVTASARFISSFGPISPSACTTVSCIAAPRQMASGERRDYIRNPSIYIVLFILKLAQNALHLEAWPARYLTISSRPSEWRAGGSGQARGACLQRFLYRKGG